MCHVDFEFLNQMSFCIKSTALQKSAISVLLISNKVIIKNQASPRIYFLKFHVINIVLPSPFLSSESLVLAILLL